MQKAIGTLAAILTLLLAAVSLSEMVASEDPPPLFKYASEIVSKVGASEDRPQGGFISRVVFGFKESSGDAWTIWLFLALAAAAVAFVGAWVVETASWGFFDIGDAGEAIGPAIVTFLAFLGLKFLVFGYQVLFG